jgi:hypothetical protein
LKNKLVLAGLLISVLAIGIVAVGCAATGAVSRPIVKQKINAEALIGQFSGTPVEGAETKERFEAIIRQLADSTIAWDDASTGTDQMDDGTAMQEVRFALRLTEPKPAVLDFLDSPAGWGGNFGGFLDREPGSVNVLVRRVLLNTGNPAIEICLVARNRNKQAVLKGITRSRFWENEIPGVLPNTVSVSEAVAYIVELLK